MLWLWDRLCDAEMDCVSDSDALWLWELDCEMQTSHAISGMVPLHQGTLNVRLGARAYSTMYCCK